MALLFSACKKDDPITCPLLADAIVGTWVAPALGTGFIDFRSDGTLIDDNDLIIGGNAGGAALTEKTWEITGDQNDTILVKAGSAASFLSINLPVDSWDCNRITIVALGVSIILERP